MKQEQIRANIKNLLCQLAVNDELPMDLTELDTTLLTPAFYGGKMRFLTIDTNTGRRVYDCKLKKYLTT